MGSQNGSLINLSTSVPDLALTSPIEQSSLKPSPDRYRRPGQKRTDSNNSTIKVTPSQAVSPISSVSAPTITATESAEDTTVNSAVAKPNRYRRRSLNSLETQHFTAAEPPRPSTGDRPSATSTPTTLRPLSLLQNGSSTLPSREDATLSAGNGAKSAIVTQAEQKTVNVPPRGSSDAIKRVASPSPLSKQAQVDDNSPSATSPAKVKTYASAAQAGMQSASPATQHLAALADKDLNKGMKSRLRRAFSFGSAQELRRGAAENHASAQQTKEQHQQQIDDELDAEQQEIARRQEEAGIGAGIYSGQGNFLGSTDNLSISSTASSASMMLRKMGRATKKGARSIKGLFRPKSVIGVPAADGPVQMSAGSAALQPSVAQVSMVTVEAERQKVNVNADPSERPHGTTGFPKLERNSLDAGSVIAKPPSRGSADGSESRRSIVGSDRDRAEVLAAVKKGILKRSGTGSPSGSPVMRPVDTTSTPTLQLPESPASSMPSTPKDGRSASFNNGAAGGDYFANRLPSMTRSIPATPNGTVRSISFSPRIQFHDAWSATEYDRRGEIATCNRLTPMLAQQIKEELNTFKMEMEVHEQSKPHTHFF